jgi:ABC-type amino acid transport substrate-binding protein
MDHKKALSLLLWALLVAPGFGQESAGGPAEELTGTLKKVRDTGVVILGYRESSIPFSYLNERGRPIGYSIDIGRAIAQSIANELGRPLADPNMNDNMVTIKFISVTSDTRMAAVTTGQVDLECGSTTNNVERQKTVAFSPVTLRFSNSPNRASWNISSKNGLCGSCPVERR